MLFKLAARVCLVTCLYLLPTLVQAQQKNVTGRVLGPSNEPISGASVVVKGTTTGTTTDEQGRFRITVPNDQSILTISYLGYNTQELSVSGVSDLNVSLVSVL